ncbi:MAG: alanine--tRNA ligase [Alphaproteobacteria bacterium]|nr:alanine--tRNA ligase [Alphaproteobacteria bacterium]
MWTVSKIRRHFLEYFQNLGHEIVPSAPLVPHNDPSLLFTSAGMVPFKNYFTGAQVPAHPRATSAQKCLRAGGKHNDLENVGYTTRHHTFFEMMGNFSFGDYFKEEAITFAWNLVHKELALPKDRLLVTVYVDDDEAATLWQKIAGLSSDKILRISGSDNFWAMGDTGPCGPCSEIFYDHGPSIAGGPPGSPDQDGDRFVEVWNLVFMQYEQYLDENGAAHRKNLPKPSIDTGSGLERLSAVLQGVHNNYETDLFKSLIAASESFSGVKASGDALVSHRVIADHLRACSFMIADGILPSNEGRGYVLRRILRRAGRHAYLLRHQEPFLAKLVPTLLTEMGEAYPELVRANALIEETMAQEEDRFRQTLGRGLKLLSQETEGLSKGGVLPGDVAFKLYDTYGFPLDLTQDILRGEGKTVDTDGFDAHMERQKEEARAHWVGSGAKADERLWFEVLAENGPTDFLGYTTLAAQGTLQALVRDGAFALEAVTGEEIFFVVNQTPFYAESGGQTGDTGQAHTQNAVLEIHNVTKAGDGLFVHHGRVVSGTLRKGDALTLEVDGARRARIKANHSATHLLHKALRGHLGEQVTQKGSLVLPDRLRFDFSYNEPLTADDLQKVEDEVNAIIRRNTAVGTKLLSTKDALETGAVALFGEKYGDEVRVVSMGDEDRTAPYSVEFCGGTHVERTGDIGFFKIVAQTSVAAGVRRLEAVTGEGALFYVRDKMTLLETLGARLKVAPDQVVPRLDALLEDRKRLEKEIKDLQRKLASGGGAGDAASSGPEMVAGVPFITRFLPDVPPKDLKSIVDQLRAKEPLGVIALLAVMDGKSSLVVGVEAALSQKISAVELVRAGANALGGKGGGGRPDMAQAGGPGTDEPRAVFEALKKTIEGSLS